MRTENKKLTEKEIVSTQRLIKSLELALKDKKFSLKKKETIRAGIETYKRMLEMV